MCTHLAEDVVMYALTEQILVEFGDPRLRVRSRSGLSGSFACFLLHLYHSIL